MMTAGTYLTNTEREMVGSFFRMLNTEPNRANPARLRLGGQGQPVSQPVSGLWPL